MKASEHSARDVAASNLEMEIPLKHPPSIQGTQCPVADFIIQWLDSGDDIEIGNDRVPGTEERVARPAFKSVEIKNDLKRLCVLRREFYSSLQSDREGHILDKAWSYAAMLSAFESKGITPPLPSKASVDPADANEAVELQHQPEEWQWSQSIQASISSSSWSNNFIRLEHCCVLYDAAALQYRRAGKCDLGNKKGLDEAKNHYEAAATTLAFLRDATQDDDDGDISSNLISALESFSLARGQVCVYQTALMRGTRPAHQTLSRIASGAADLFKSSNTVLSSSDWTEGKFESLILANLCQARAEYHEAIHSGEIKFNKPLEIARLRLSIEKCELAFQTSTEYCRVIDDAESLKSGGSGGSYATNTSPPPKKTTADSSNLPVLEDVDDLGNGPAGNEFLTTSHISLLKDAQSLRDDVKRRLQETERTLENTNDADTPDNLKLTPIRSQNSVTKRLRMTDALLRPTFDPPLFQGILDEEANRVVKTFNKHMFNLTERLKEMVFLETERARSRLAEVSLPQTLTQYYESLQQDNDGAGAGIISDKLWEDINTFQTEGEVEQIKEDLWSLRDTSDTARTMLDALVTELDGDINMDKHFRNENPRFGGHTPAYVQSPIRQNISKCQAWLENARKGDAVLFKMLDSFDIEPKFKFLACDRSQLEQLVAPKEHDRLDSYEEIDTSALERLLTKLSNLIRDRETTLQSFCDDVRNYDFRARIVEVHCNVPSSSSADNGSQDPSKSSQAMRLYEDVRRVATDSFQSSVDKIEGTVERQSDLIERIYAENETFREALNQESSISGKGYRRMLEDGLTSVHRVQKQIVEGRNFYDVIISFLKQMRQQVSDISVRLAVERYDFEDKARSVEQRKRQEAEDARVAEELARRHERERREELERDGNFAVEIARRFQKEAAAIRSSSSVKGGGVSKPGSIDDSLSRLPDEGNDDSLGPLNSSLSSISVPSSGVDKLRGDHHRSMTYNAEKFDLNERSISSMPEFSIELDSPDRLPEEPVDESIEKTGSTKQTEEKKNEAGSNLSIAPAGTSASTKPVTTPTKQNEESNRPSTKMDDEPIDNLKSLPTAEEEDASSEEIETKRIKEDLPSKKTAPRQSSEGSAIPPPAQGRPGVYAVSHYDSPSVIVDDEKVASLVAMDFDADKVVDALQRYDNNVDQALNHLLMDG